MFNIKNKVLYKYVGNDNVVVLPDSVEKIEKDAFEGNDNIEVIIGNNVKEVGYNSINLPNLRVIKLPNVQEIKQLSELRKLEYLNVNINTVFESIKYLNPNLKLEITNGKNSTLYTSNQNLLDKLNYNNKEYNKEDFFMLVFNKKVKRFAINDRLENYTLFLNNICFIERFLNNIPKKIKNLIFDKGYNFCILNDKIILNDEYIGGIIINDLVLISAEEVNDCFGRETARIIDDEYNISCSEEFDLCYKLESFKLYSKTKTLKIFDIDYIRHVTINSHEYFCECFSRFYKNENILKDECPRTWNYLSNLEYIKQKVKIYG